MSMSVALDVFQKCVEAVQQGELIESVSAKDKEFHFQNWFQKRLESLGLFFEASGRNTTLIFGWSILLMVLKSKV